MSGSTVTHSPLLDIITNLLQEHTIHQLDTHGCVPYMFYEATFCHNHDCNCNIFQCLYHMLVQGDGTLCFFCSLDQLLKRNYIITVVHSVTSVLFMKKSAVVQCAKLFSTKVLLLVVFRGEPIKHPSSALLGMLQTPVPCREMAAK